MALEELLMSVASTLEWTEATWTPSTGCHKISPGCAHCYAERFAERWRSIPEHPDEQGFDVKIRHQRLAMLLSWKRSRRSYATNDTSSLRSV